MANDSKSNKATVVGAATGENAFLSKAAAEAAARFQARTQATEIFTDRPVIKPNKIGKANFMPVIGYLVEHLDLPLPAGAPKRINPNTKEEITTWGAFVIALTEPTVALSGGDDGDIVPIEKGREVFVAENNSVKLLHGFLGKPEMFEVCLLWDGELELAGRQPMVKWRVQVGAEGKARTGAFLRGGSQAHAALNGGVNMGSSIHEIEQVAP